MQKYVMEKRDDIKKKIIIYIYIYNNNKTKKRAHPHLDLVCMRDLTLSSVEKELAFMNKFS